MIQKAFKAYKTTFLYLIFSIFYMFEIFNYKFKKTNLHFIYDMNNYILNFDSNLRIYIQIMQISEILNYVKQIRQ